MTMPSCISVTVNEVNNKYLWGCYGRSCLERVIFSLMVILMVGVLLIAGLLCVLARPSAAAEMDEPLLHLLAVCFI